MMALIIAGEGQSRQPFGSWMACLDARTPYGFGDTGQIAYNGYRGNRNILCKFKSILIF
jgi:hypothetical protein